MYLRLHQTTNIIELEITSVSGYAAFVRAVQFLIYFIYTGIGLAINRYKTGSCCKPFLSRLGGKATAPEKSDGAAKKIRLDSTWKAHLSRLK